VTDRPPTARTASDLRLALVDRRRAGGIIGFVPTMGALHVGHLSLVRAAASACDVVVVSIFVNPLQFGPGEDLDAYPRTLDADLDLLAGEGVDVVFVPSAPQFTPADGTTTVHVSGLTEGLEAGTRPTHFDGVTTIVAKLLHVVGPDRAYFGEKDFQQQAVIRRMVSDLDMPVEVVTCPVVREPDGLALSSRNTYLSETDRQHALALSAALRDAAASWDGDADRARALLRERLDSASGVRLDYAEVVDPDLLVPLHGHVEAAQAVVAAHVGPTRLIDTMALAE
jgi:pantoate--beta-alanine ligase